MKDLNGKDIRPATVAKQLFLALGDSILAKTDAEVTAEVAKVVVDATSDEVANVKKRLPKISAKVREFLITVKV